MRKKIDALFHVSETSDGHIISEKCIHPSEREVTLSHVIFDMVGINILYLCVINSSDFSNFFFLILFYLYFFCQTSASAFFSL